MAEVISTNHGNIPRFVSLYTNTLVVAEGEEFVLPSDSDYDAIEVGGTLKVSRDYDTICKFIHLTILPTGLLDIGTVDDPANKKVEFIVKDAPLSAENDPNQWGNGIINLGTFMAYGNKLDKTWVRMEEVEAGATEIELEEVPAGWKVGDTLLIPDTQQLRYGTYRGAQDVKIRKEGDVYISGINNTTVSLSKPLDFEHLGGRRFNGELKFKPLVANVSRNIIVKSENPEGTFGHIINTGNALADVRYAAFVNLGRTSVENIDNSTFDADGNLSHFGTNVIGRYAFHYHHVHNHGHNESHPHFGHVIGCFLDGGNKSKWGIVVHQTHDTHVADNVCDNFVGSGIVTEDGPEVRNVFDRNFVMGCKGNGINGKFNFVAPNFKPGAEGAGFWFHGMQNYIRNNVSINNAVGFQYFYRNQVGNSIPSIPGGEYDATINPKTVVPLECTDNEGIANAITGHETWNNPVALIIENLSVWHNGQAQVKPGGGESAFVTINNLFALDKNWWTHGISSSAAYNNLIKLDNAVIEGCSIGFGDARYIYLDDCLLKNVVNINFVIRPYKMELNSVISENLDGFPLKSIVFNHVKDWQSGDSFPSYYSDWEYDQTGHKYVLKNWQGQPENDYLIFETYSLRDKPAWPSSSNPYYAVRFCPETGLTMGECWDKYGLALGGGVLSEEDKLLKEDFVGCYLKAGTDYPLGSAGLIITSPSMNEPTVFNNGKTRIDFIKTGINQHNSKDAFIQIDDLPEYRLRMDQYGPSPTHNFSFKTSFSMPDTPGTHQIRTWVADDNNEKIVESERIFYYFVDEPTQIEHKPTIESVTASSITVTQGEMLSIFANGVDDLDGNLVEVKFFVDGTLVVDVASDPFVIDFDTTPLAVGNHIFSAIAVDSTGLESDEKFVSVEIVEQQTDCAEEIAALQQEISILQGKIDAAKTALE